MDTCRGLDLPEACAATAAEGACQDDSRVPWAAMFLCSANAASGTWLGAATVRLLAVLTAMMVVWLGVKLLGKTAEIYFAPTLQDLCARWSIPSRTAAALFVALANGAPDLASTAEMFKAGQADMAYGALLGAGNYVCMIVASLIIQLPPAEAVAANTAMARDVISYLVLLFMLLAVFQNGLSLPLALVLLAFYSTVAITVCSFDQWHRLGRPGWATVFGDDAAFEPLSGESGDEVTSVAPRAAADSDSRLLDSYIEQEAQRMHASRENRVQSVLQGLREHPGPDSRHPGVGVEEELLPLQQLTPPAAPLPIPVQSTPLVHSLGAADAHAVHVSAPGWPQPSGMARGSPEAHDALAGQRVLSSPSSASGFASGSASNSLLILPGDSVSQQNQQRRGEVWPASGLAIPMELEVSNPRRFPVSSRAVNDSLRLLSIVLPPGGAVSQSQPAGGADGSPLAAAGRAPTPAGPHAPSPASSPRLPALAAVVANIFDVPDFTEFVALDPQERMAVHYVMLAVLLPLALAMRLTVPTLTEDVYDPVIYVLSMVAAPFALPWIMDLGWGLWLQVVLSIGCAAVALALVACGGFTTPVWLRKDGIAGRLCMLALSAVTMVMAVGWIQLVAGEVVGCLRALGLLIHCPSTLLGFMLAVTNSLADQATNLSVGRVSGKRAALAACYSGMTFNLTFASIYGWVLYTSQTEASTVPVQLSTPTWILWAWLVFHLTSTLVAMAWEWVAAGQPALPQSFGWFGRCSFVCLTVVFIMQGIWQWLHY